MQKRSWRNGGRLLGSKKREGNDDLPNAQSDGLPRRTSERSVYASILERPAKLCGEQDEKSHKKGLQNFNLSLIRYLMQAQSKGTAQFASEIEVTREHLSRVLNRQVPLSEDIGRRLSGVLGVSWDVIQKPESVHQTDLINLSLVEFLHEPGALD